MVSAPVAAAAERLRAAALAPVVDELVRRFTRGERPVVLVVRSAPTETQRAVADLFGLARLPGDPARIRTGRLLDALGLADVEELRLAAEQLRGPLPDRRVEREVDRSARSHLWAWLLAAAKALTIFDEDTAALWVSSQKAFGVRGGVEEHRRRLERAVSVLGALPADGVSLAVLADRHAGGPHELDRGRTLTAIVMDGISRSTGGAPPEDAESWRGVWESVGVVPDQLSSAVLALGLPGDDDTAMGRWLAAARTSTEPVSITLSTLRRWPVRPLPASASVYVFENPSVLAEAQRRQWSGPPLVCSSGRPTVATVVLLRQLSAGGAPVYQHADFDAAGVSITSWLAERAGTTPWRMTSADYLDALARGRAVPVIAGRMDTPWDPPLGDLMVRHAHSVYEEALVDELLGDAALT